MSISQKKGGALLNYMMLFSNVIIKFLYTPFLLRLLGQEEYGLYSLAITIVGYLTVLDLGFGSTVTRYTVKYRTEGNTDMLFRMYSTLSLIYILIGIVALLLCLAISVFSQYLFGGAMTTVEISKLQMMLFLCGLNLLFTFPLQISASVLIAYEKFIYKNGIKLAVIYLQPLTMILLMYFLHIKSVGAIVIVTGFNLLTYLLYYIYAKKKLDFRVSFSKIDKTIVKPLVTFSMAMFAMTVFEKLQFQSGQFVLGMTIGTKAVAVWGIAMVFVLNFRSISTTITNVYMPSFFSLVFKEQSDEMVSIVRKMVRIQTLVLCVVLFNFIIFGKPFILLWAGDAYIEAYVITIVIMVPMVFALLTDFGYLYQIAKHQLMYRNVTFYGGFVFAFIVVYSIFRISLVSYAYIVALSIIISQILLMLVFINKNIKIDLKPILKDFLKFVSIPLLVSSISFYFVREFIDSPNWLLLTISVVVYNIVLLAVFWFFSLTSSEKRMIIKKR